MDIALFVFDTLLPYALQRMPHTHNIETSAKMSRMPVNCTHVGFFTEKFCYRTKKYLFLHIQFTPTPDMTKTKKKTRDYLVDAARKLFAQKGKNNVTMNDIALAADKGRRTIYTYFRNKDEVYLAVIENELDQLIERLQEVMDCNMPADKKLETYIFTRFEAVKEAVMRNGSLKADFFRNIYEVEKARRAIDIKEIRLLKRIYEQGIADGIFNLQNPQWAAMMTLYALKGLEAPYLNNAIGNYIKDNRSMIMEKLFDGLLKRP